MTSTKSLTPHQTKPVPTKQPSKVAHIAGTDAIDEARRTGMPKVPSLCGMTLMPVRSRYVIVEYDTAAEAAPPMRRTCKRCLAVLGKWQRIEDNRVIRELETQFGGGGHA